MDCDFCKKKFASKSNLYTHQKTAKFCLKLQGKDNQKNFDCKYCDKVLTQRSSLEDHLDICKEKQRQLKVEQDIQQKTLVKRLESEIVHLKKSEKDKLKEKDKYYEEKLKEKNEYISKLEAKLEKFEDSILSKTDKKYPSTTNNTTNNIVINNSLNLNDIEKMNSFLDENLDKNVLAGGQKSFALLMSTTILKDKYKCVDPSRQNFEFTNELGELERDVKAKKLTNALIKGDICSKSADKGIKLWTKDDGSTDSLSRQAHSANVFDMINFDRDNSTFRSELTALTS